MDLDMTFNDKLREALIGRTIRADALPHSNQSLPMYELWGEDAGIPESDIHSSQAYRIYLNYDNNTRQITGVWVQIDGEILSPCSGYSQEVLDQFDYEPILNWCFKQLEPQDE